MDENRNPFDSTQPNSNPSEPTQTGTHNTPSTNILNRRHMVNRKIPTTKQGKNIGIQNRISKQKVLIFRHTNGILPIREIFHRTRGRPDSKLHVAPMGSNILTEQNSRILGIKMIVPVHFPIGMDSIGKMEQDFSLLLSDGLLRNQKRR